MRRRIAVVLGVAFAMASVLIGVGASASNASPLLTTCNGVYSGVTFSTLTVPAWASCKVSDSHVVGAVTVNPGAEFDACNVSVGGSVNATNAYVNIDSDSSITGSLNLSKPGAPAIAVGGSPCSEKGTTYYSAFVCPHYVGGSVNVLNAPSLPLEVSIGECGDMSIHGGVTIQGNRQYVEIEDATITGSLICLNNYPLAEANDVTVGGARIGCASNMCY